MQSAFHIYCSCEDLQSNAVMLLEISLGFDGNSYHKGLEIASVCVEVGLFYAFTTFHANELLIRWTLIP